MAILPQGLSKAELQKLYGRSGFRNFNLHHMVSSSCGGETSEFNLFPYRTRSHNAYNCIFLNMTIWQVWEKIEEIYGAIFDTDEEKINRYWLEVCQKIKAAEKLDQVEKKYRAIYLQDKWIVAFGGDSLNQARNTLKYMMLFMIFGSCMADIEYLFDNGNLTEFFEKYPANNDRLRAFNICFGETADWQRIKSRMSKILNN